MSNLIRGRQDFLFNTLSTKDFGMYYEGGVATGRPHLVIKEPGIDIPAGTVDVKVLEAVTGTKQKKTLSIAWLWDGRGSKVFEIEITRQPLYSGFGHEQFPVSKSYQYKIPAFVTSTTGTLHNTDKETIVNGLVAAINADVQLNRNAVNTGAAVVASRTGQTLVLEAKEVGVEFTVRTFDDFTQVENVAFKKNTLTYEEIARLFAIKAENEGQIVQQPLPSTEYVKIQLIQKTNGYDNTSASAYNVREQIYNLYIPKALIDDDIFTALAVPAGDPLAVPSMTDAAGSTDASLEDYLEIVKYPVRVQSINGTLAAKTLASTTGTFDFRATLTILPAEANQGITYTSSDATKATVNADGLVTGLATGSTNITATTVDGAKTFVCAVTVP